MDVYGLSLCLLVMISHIGRPHEQIQPLLEAKNILHQEFPYSLPLATKDVWRVFPIFGHADDLVH